MTDRATRIAGAATSVPIVSFNDAATTPRFDDVAIEEPLQIRIIVEGTARDLAITMRTPGHDFELAAGFLFAEGVVRSPRDITAISYCVDDQVAVEQRYNIVTVELRNEARSALTRLERHFAIGSSCGVCGKARLEDLQARGVTPLPDGASIAVETIVKLPELLEQRQRGFAVTGGLHASALFDLSGNLEAIREDVGRHNAMDKLIGWGLLDARLPYSQRVALVSGRSSFEIVQKAAVAGIPILCAVSAPSSLAVATAEAFNVTLVGFLRGRRFNVYAGAHRIT
ncbi:MAG: formate dehydrogenase accessory sulfurtransferase FdhD [Candidatus Eremiobacteraeota bacterium]|nr:formate dehydrogenase accessory sulfurtransferase FdhD [Candidatus Eremiobacteraeota bacterium]